MNRIDKVFQDRNKTKLFPYIPAGYPDMEVTESLIYDLVCSGADLIELGVPFSDPIADGSVIQEASYEALLGGVNLDKIFELVAKVRGAGVSIPIVLMGYFNSFFRYGLNKTADQAKIVGIDGFIVPDLLPFSTNDKEDFAAILAAKELHQIFLASIITEETRLKQIVEASSGFLYLISKLGVTGVSNKMDFMPIKLAVERIKKIKDIPVAIGFGIANKEQTAILKEYGDALIVGSAVVKKIKAGDAGIFIKELKSTM
ncbi:MAG: tryptophan synthase subunit alpha [bacterium]|nr:tryptophan synthase subunit alpha [bacterium]